MRKPVEADFLFHVYFIDSFQENIALPSRENLRIFNQILEKVLGESFGHGRKPRKHVGYVQNPQSVNLKQRRKYTPRENLSLYVFQS